MRSTSMSGFLVVGRFDLPGRLDIGPRLQRHGVVRVDCDRAINTDQRLSIVN
jgi:hypothetical protein